VVRSLKDSKLQRAADDPIYAFPWFLFLGESAGGKSALIKGSRPLSSVAAGQEGPTRNCDWWFFDKAVVLDASGRYAFHTK
jgi:type VI secretion system protein ImpL